MSEQDKKSTLPSFAMAADLISALQARSKSSPSIEVPKPPPPQDSRNKIVEFAGFIDNVTEKTIEIREPEHTLLRFSLDKEEFALPVQSIREIVRVSSITRIPDAPEHIRGVMNLRGRMFAVVELRTRLGLSALAIDKSSRVIVAEAYGKQIGLLVDAVSQIVTVKASSLKALPEEIAMSPLAEYVQGMIEQDEKLFLLLHPEKVLLLPQRIESRG